MALIYKFFFLARDIKRICRLQFSKSKQLGGVWGQFEPYAS